MILQQLSQPQSALRTPSHLIFSQNFVLSVAWQNPSSLIPSLPDTIQSDTCHVALGTLCYNPPHDNQNTT